MLHFNYAIVRRNFVFLCQFVPFKFLCQFSRHFESVQLLSVLTQHSKPTRSCQSRLHLCDNHNCYICARNFAECHVRPCGEPPNDDICTFWSPFHPIFWVKSLFDQIFYRNEQLGGPGFICHFLSPNRSCIMYRLSFSCTKYYGDPREKNKSDCSQLIFHRNEQLRQIVYCKFS